MKPVQIIGGGLAGLTLGLLLVRRGVPVSVLEAGEYPRHKVCGEFLSGRGLELLEREGLLDGLVQRGARAARTAAFFTDGGGAVRRELPQTALCLSRFALDAELASRFVRAGGQLKTRTRWRGDVSREGMVRAGGRRPHPTSGGWRWYGVKAHAKQLSLVADVEMHLLREGYVGLCGIEGERVNVCGLFRARPGAAGVGRDWVDWLCRRGPDSLSGRLRGAEFDPASFTAVAGLSPGKRTPAEADEFSVGDAMSMIPPITGNGMSIALESASLAVEPLTCYARESISWRAAVDRYRAGCRRAFRWRLRSAACLHGVLFRAPLAGAMIRCVLRWDPAWRWLFGGTR
ncbi:MAG TPA: FAD-dependent monooxygenase [Methylomirabilota bacterium]|nr:FAD-dependent monooxygenase [Methylomirabilota bacterium]